LSAETRQRLRIAPDFVGKKFQRDKAMQPRVFGFVDDAHPAAAEFLDDAVMRNGLADHAGGTFGGSGPDW
jgi:hypothetical protein